MGSLLVMCWHQIWAHFLNFAAKKVHFRRPITLAEFYNLRHVNADWLFKNAHMIDIKLDLQNLKIHAASMLIGCLEAENF